MLIATDSVVTLYYKQGSSQDYLSAKDTKEHEEKRFTAKDAKEREGKTLIRE
jgi:hypothetical protein